MRPSKGSAGLSSEGAGSTMRRARIAGGARVELLAMLVVGAVGCGQQPAPAADAAAAPPAAAGAGAAAADAAQVPLLAPMVVSAPVVEVVDAATHRAEVDAWAAGRLERLTREDGWLSLVGLAWLEPGETTLGSAAESGVVLPAHLPATIGTVTLTPTEPGATPGAPEAGARLRFVAAPGVTVTSGGAAVSELDLVADSAGKPTELEVGSVRFYPIERRGRLALRIKDAEAPTRTGFLGLERYPVDLAWRVIARFEPYDPPRSLAIPNILGGVDATPSPGALVFTLGGTEHRVDVVDEEPASGDNDLFVIFGDATNGDTTYGGGRFLYVAPPDAEGRLVLDFNRAYNPPCVFTPYATCPLPPPQNKLGLRVEAGEKRYAGH